MPTVAVADSGSWKQKVTTPKTTLAMASAFSIMGKKEIKPQVTGEVML